MSGPILEYSLPKKPDPVQGYLVFMPIVITICVCLYLGYVSAWFPDGAYGKTISILQLAGFLLSEIVTVSMLVVWRHRLGWLPLVFGWLLVMFIGMSFGCIGGVH